MRSPRPEPYNAALKWLRANKHDLAPLTGTDSKALIAIDRAWELFCYTRSERVLQAIGLLAAEMQPSMRPLAKELAARAMDWGDRDRHWPKVAKYGGFDARSLKAVPYVSPFPSPDDGPLTIGRVVGGVVEHADSIETPERR